MSNELTSHNSATVSEHVGHISVFFLLEEALGRISHGWPERFLHYRVAKNGDAEHSVHL